MPMLSQHALMAMGFQSVGQGVRVSDRASFYGIERISLGDEVRIDDFCVISAGVGGIEVGRNVHIAIGASLIGAGRIIVGDFVGLSSRVSIYSSNDDYTGAAMTGPTLPREYTNIRSADVYLGRHVIIGSGSVVLPGIRIEEGAAIGALSLVTKNCEPFEVYSGVPAKRIKSRKRDLLLMEKAFLESRKKTAPVHVKGDRVEE